MRLGRGFTAAARRVPRLAGLAGYGADWHGKDAIRRKAARQGVTPCTPDCAHSAQGRRGTCRLTGFYRRSATGLAARESGRLRRGSVPAPRTARHRRAGYSGDMRLGRGFTAARRQASRLAGLAGFVAVCFSAKKMPPDAKISHHNYHARKNKNPTPIRTQKGRKTYDETTDRLYD